MFPSSRTLAAIGAVCLLAVPAFADQGADGSDPITPTLAMTPSPDHAKHALTFRSHPYPETSAFFILQAGYVAIVKTDDHLAEGRPLLDFGLMKNLGRHWAVGGTFHVEAGDGEGGYGPMVRGRRWLGQDASFDLSTGFLVPTDTDPGGGGGTETAWVNQAELNFGNILSLTGEMQTWRKEYGALQSLYGAPAPSASGTNWYAGGRLSYLPGIIGVVAFGVLIATVPWD